MTATEFEQCSCKNIKQSSWRPKKWKPRARTPFLGVRQVSSVTDHIHNVQKHILHMGCAHFTQLTKIMSIFSHNKIMSMHTAQLQKKKKKIRLTRAAPWHRHCLLSWSYQILKKFWMITNTFWRKHTKSNTVKLWFDHVLLEDNIQSSIFQSEIASILQREKPNRPVI